MWSPRKKLFYCTLANSVTLVAVIVVLAVFAADSPYWRVGWNDTLVVISVRVDTAVKYAVVLVFIGLINIIKVLVEEIGGPLLGFTIYNPDKHHITAFTKNELQIYANLMSFITNLREALMILVAITQVDLAVASVVICELTTVATVRMLLNAKTFGVAGEGDEEELLGL